jgi:phytoene/squalene synthetase
VKSKTDFYQEHLDHVSRSFAFCIRELDGQMRLDVSLSYLLFRILDTIEDANWATTAAQDLSFYAFADFLIELPEPAKYSAWCELFPQSLSDPEKSLLHDGHKLLHELYLLPKPVFDFICLSLMNMLRGMRYFSTDSHRSIQKGGNAEEKKAVPKNAEHKGVEHHSKELRLQNLIEVNQYCFFVAGVVGELLEDLYHFHSPNAHLLSTSESLIQAFHFGLFLQKINVLKDQIEDEALGRYLVPNRVDILHSLIENAKCGFKYLASIPRSDRGYRIFCAWSLFLGLASIPWILERSLTQPKLKIPRVQTRVLLERVKWAISDQRKLEQLFTQLLNATQIETPAISPMGISNTGFTEFTRLYSGRLNPDNLSQLGLV